MGPSGVIPRASTSKEGCDDLPDGEAVNGPEGQDGPRAAASPTGLLLGTLGGLLLVISSGAHAFLGWPPLGRDLSAGGIEAGVVRAVSTGWYFGSVAMLALGLLVLWMVGRARRGLAGGTGGAWIIAAAYGGFGAVAFVAQDLNPHFILFIVNGLLIGGFAALVGIRTNH